MSDDDDATDPQKRLSESDIEKAELADWRVLFLTLHARFRTGDFETGLKLVKKIGKAANRADHHPEIDLSYPLVDVRLSSHDVGGVTSRDRWSLSLSLNGGNVATTRWTYVSLASSSLGRQWAVTRRRPGRAGRP